MSHVDWQTRVYFSFFYLVSLTVPQHDTSLVEGGDSEVIEEFGTGAYNAQFYYKRNAKTTG